MAWATLIATGVLEQLQQLIKRLQIQTMQTAKMLNERQWRILALLTANRAMISNADVQHLTSASHMTAARDLAQMVHMGLLEKHGAGRAIKYTRK
jgi:Fic family protein